MIKASLKRSQMKTKAATARKNPFHHSIHLIIQDAKYFLRPGIEPSEIGVKGAQPLDYRLATWTTTEPVWPEKIAECL